MARYTRVKLHSGRVIWPEHQGLEEVLYLRRTRPPHIWTATYQGRPTSPSGAVFRREWWAGKNRYDPTDQRLIRSAIRRWISWDTAGSVTAGSAFSCALVLEMQPDYKVLIREVFRERLPFPELVPAISVHGSRWYNMDGGRTLASVVIEGKSTGTPAFQVIQAGSEGWLKDRLWTFLPEEDKATRAQRVAWWCRDDCVLLPNPGPAVPWLMDLEDELFDFPESAYADQVDALSQGLWMLREHIETGRVARMQYRDEQDERRQLAAAGIVRDGGLVFEAAGAR